MKKDKKDYDNKTSQLTTNGNELEIHAFINLNNKQSRRQGLRALKMAVLIVEAEGNCEK